MGSERSTESFEELDTDKANESSRNVILNALDTSVANGFIHSFEMRETQLRCLDNQSSPKPVQS